MPAKIYYDNDADLGLLQGQDGRHHRLRQPGPRPRAEPEGHRLRRRHRPATRARRAGPGREGTASRSCSVAEAAKAGDVIKILLPDEAQGDVYEEEIKPNLKPGQDADVRARLQHPLRPDRAADRRGRDPDRAQGTRPPGARASSPRAAACPRSSRCTRTRRARPRRSRWPTPRASAAPAAGVIETTFKEETETDLFGEQAVLCGGVSRAGQGRLRNAGRSRLPARDGLLRVHARAEADRRPVLPGRPQLHALQRLQHRRVRRLHPRPADRHRRDQGGDEEDPHGDPARPVRPRVDPGEQGQPRRLQGHAPPRRRAPDRRGRQAAAQA